MNRTKTLNYVFNSLITRDGAIRQCVIDKYLNTGEAVLIADLEKQFDASRATVIKALSVDGAELFDFRLTASVEPSKKLLRMFGASLSPKHGLAGPFATV